MTEKKILNLGCGYNKLTNAVNLDIESKFNPDVVHDFREKLPFDDKCFEKVYMFHTIEHLEKKHHGKLLGEIRRVLVDEGKLIVSYPEFAEIARRWLDNDRGMRDFWESTIYGRQLHTGDAHVSLMHSPSFGQLLRVIGFRDIIFSPEPPPNEFNTICICYKGEPQMSYEEVIFKEVCQANL